MGGTQPQPPKTTLTPITMTSSETPSLLTPSILTHLTTLYTSPTRHYHSLSHIHTLLSLLTTHAPLFTDPPAIHASIWFHDAIYDSLAKPPANEVASAELAVSLLADTVVSDRLERIRVMIEATATHTLPSLADLKSEDPGHLRDAAMFLDMDLGILGAGEEEYAEYERGVRREYDWVGEREWKVGRGEVLRGFLGRERIYHSEVFGGLWEGRARGNIRGSLERLKRGEGEGQGVRGKEGGGEMEESNREVGGRKLEERSGKDSSDLN